ncbi:lipopolysaccharide biosynthesis protein [Erwinia persicina]|uniref:lipopolysaccharide biosynthesis protein n=1 Tax=Erwinia persicina TaxID=55211 RepID=UPI00177CFB94|nr:lipopolysaccharide biosynthesis protein [Erwinia persicina]MBD8215872.1 lipopolysaccharide biosynthesis protein [Erwinia persicina]
MKHWFSDGVFRTILRNTAYLGSGNVASALLGLLALSCAGKGMSPALFGVLVVIQSYAKTISDVMKFQTWQLVVQYGTPALANNNLLQFREVISFSLGLDLASGAAAIAGGMLLLPFLAQALGLDAHSFWLAILYCTLIPSMAASTPTGILRALDRFDLIAVQQAVRPFLRAAGSVISFAGDFGFAGFMLTWYVSDLMGGVLYWWFAARELRRRGIHHAFRPRLLHAARNLPGAWGFVWATNIAHSIWAARNSGSTVLVGIVSGPAAAGLFKIAMTFLSATGTPASLMEKSFYPEMMRLDPRTKRPWLLGLKSALLAGGIGLAVALVVLMVGQPLVSLVFGHQYLEAYDLIQVMLCAVVVSMMGFPQESLLLMAGKQRAFLVAQAISSVTSMLLLVGLSHFFGVSGAAFAYAAGQCVDVLLLLVPTLRAYRHRHLLPFSQHGERPHDQQTSVA